MANLLVLILQDVSKLKAILDAWEAIGVPGVTILHSMGQRRAKGLLGHDDPLMNSLRDLLHVEELHNRTLLSLIDDEEVLGKAKRAAGDILEDFSAPNTGILFVLPVGEVLGVRKRQAAVERPPEPVVTAPEARLFTRTMSVAKLDAMLNLKPAIVRREDSLQQVAMEMVKDPAIRIISVVDEEDHLVGLLHLQSVCDDLFFHLMPEEFLAQVSDLDEVVDFATRSRMRTAGDAMTPVVWVKPHESVGVAFKRMHEHQVPGLPVVDDELHVIGYINLVELLSVWLRTQPEETT